MKAFAKTHTMLALGLFSLAGTGCLSVDCADTDLSCSPYSAAVLWNLHSLNRSSLFVGEKAFLGASGGSPPYAYTMFSGDGFVTRSGLFTARPRLGLGVVQITDAGGLVSRHVIAATGGVGNGTFTAPVSLSSCANSTDIRSADLDSDGNRDLVVGCSTPSQFQVFRGTGNGAFAAPVAVAGSGPGYHVAVGDLNNDGLFDVVADFDGLTNPGLGAFTGKGDGSFDSPIGRTTITAGKVTGYVDIVDLNNDQIGDVVAAIQADIETYIGTGDATIVGNSSNFASPDATLRAGIEDFNGDGLLDIVAGKPTTPASFRYHQNDGAGNFPTNSSFNCTGVFGVVGNAVPVDLNADGNMDVVCIVQSTTEIVVALGNGAGSFGGFASYAATPGGNPLDGAIGDFNSDARLDVAVVDGGLNQLLLYFGNGDGTLQAGVIVAAGALNSPSNIHTADLNNDGRLDLVTNSTGATISILFGN